MAYRYDVPPDQLLISAVTNVEVNLLITNDNGFPVQFRLDPQAGPGSTTGGIPTIALGSGPITGCQAEVQYSDYVIALVPPETVCSVPLKVRGEAPADTAGSCR